MIAEGSAAAKGLSTARIRSPRSTSRLRQGVPETAHAAILSISYFHGSRRVVRASDNRLAKKEVQNFVGLPYGVLHNSYISKTLIYQ